MKNKRGITLIALVLTIIVLIILAGISLNALIGENVILGQAMNAKNKQDEASIKEDIMMAWAARMSKFYEDASAGRESWNNKEIYLCDAEKLTEMLGSGKGTVTSVSYNQDTGNFHIEFTSIDNIEYAIDLNGTGDIINFARKDDSYYTDVWVSYYEIAGVGTLTYASSKDVKKDGQEPVVQWDITQADFSDYKNVPWYYYDGTIHYNDGYHHDDGYISKIKTVEILDNITPRNTKYLFYNLQHANSFLNLNRLFNNITSLGYRIFSGCEELTNVEIPDNITNIEGSAFYDCKALATITMSRNINNIGSYAFYNTNLTDVGELPNNIKVIKEDMFNGCKNLTNIKIPNGVTKIESGAFNSCKSLKSIEIPNSVTEIGIRAFKYCDLLESITIPENVKIMEWECFDECPKLETITYNAIDASESNCTNKNNKNYIFGQALKSLIIGENVKVIPDYMFSLTNIEEVVIPDSVEIIGYKAFYDCNSLINITIGKNVKNIGKASFQSCDQLSTINYNAIDASESVFSNDDGTVTLPFKGVGENLHIGGNVRTIPDYIFMSMKNITSLTLNQGLESIGTQAFRNLQFSSIIIPSSVDTIGAYAFYNCTNLTSITLRKATDTISGKPWGAPNGVGIVTWSP